MKVTLSQDTKMYYKALPKKRDTPKKVKNYIGNVLNKVLLTNVYFDLVYITKITFFSNRNQMIQIIVILQYQH